MQSAKLTKPKPLHRAELAKRQINETKKTKQCKERLILNYLGLEFIHSQLQLLTAMQDACEIQLF